MDAIGFDGPCRSESADALVSATGWHRLRSSEQIVAHSASQFRSDIKSGSEHVIVGGVHTFDAVVVGGGPGGSSCAALLLVGAGGTNCLVARGLFSAKPRRPVAAQELEFEAPSGEIAATRIGEDGKPEILLHQDLRGYAWNVPKTNWLNVGCGTAEPTNVKPAWSKAREFFQDQRHMPTSAEENLDRAKGHSYYLFDPRHLRDCQNDNAFLVGDALVVAPPLSADGILPSILSGRLCAEAIVDHQPPSYRARLEEHPIFADYEFLYRARERASTLRPRSSLLGWSSALHLSCEPSREERLLLDLHECSLATPFQAGLCAVY